MAKFIPFMQHFGARLALYSRQLTMGGGWAERHPETTQKNLRAFFFDGVFSATSDNITINYLVLFVLALGASRAQIGLLTALASLAATLLLIPGAILADRTGKRKWIVLVFGGGVARLMILLLALLPFAFAGQTVIYIAIGLKVIQDGMANLSLPAWVSMTADVVPLKWRGRYFGTRNLVMGVAGMLITYLAGALITGVGGVEGYQWALGAAFVLGMVATYSYSRIQEPSVMAVAAGSAAYRPKALWSLLTSNRNFFTYWGYTALWNLSLNIAGPFFTVYLVQDLKGTATMVGLMAIVSSLAGIPSQRFWGALADRWGARRVQDITGFLIPLLPLAWVFITAPWQAIFINVFGGILWAGYGLASFNFLLEMSPTEERARTSALYQIAVAISTSLGAAIGGLIANRWGIVPLFMLSFMGRLIAAVIFNRFVKQPTTKPEPAITEMG